MFQPGDLIMYDKMGVCRVEGIQPRKDREKREKLFYKLSALYENGTIFIPVDTAIFMRPILSADEVNALIDSLPGIQENVCRNGNLRVLSDHYHAAFESHHCEDLLQLLKSVYSKEQSAIKEKKHLGMVDQQYKKKAETLVYGEFAAALGIPYDAVEGYIAKRLGS